MAVLATCLPASAVDYTWTVLAGRPMPQMYADGKGSAAWFNQPQGAAADAAGNIYVADSSNHLIRKVTLAGVVTTVAGVPGVPGSADGPAAVASFRYPQAVAVDAAGNVYVADTGNATIRKIDANGIVTTLAGTAGIMGWDDGPGSVATFVIPTGLAVDTAGNVYVVDFVGLIREISSTGMVTTLAGRLNLPVGIDGPVDEATFSNPQGVAVDGAGNVYVADTGEHAIRVISGGTVSTLAANIEVSGSANGQGGNPIFSIPRHWRWMRWAMCMWQATAALPSAK